MHQVLPPSIRTQPLPPHSLDSKITRNLIRLISPPEPAQSIAHTFTGARGRGFCRRCFVGAGPGGKGAGTHSPKGCGGVGPGRPPWVSQSTIGKAPSRVRLKPTPTTPPPPTHMPNITRQNFIKTGMPLSASSTTGATWKTSAPETTYWPQPSASELPWIKWKTPSQ